VGKSHWENELLRGCLFGVTVLRHQRAQCHWRLCRNSSDALTLSPEDRSFGLGTVFLYEPCCSGSDRIVVLGYTPPMRSSTPPSPPPSAPPPRPFSTCNGPIPIISLITPPSAHARDPGTTNPGSASSRAQSPSQPCTPGTSDGASAAEAVEKPREPLLEYQSTRAMRRRAQRDAGRRARLARLAADARRAQKAASAANKPSYEGEGKGRAKDGGSSSVDRAASASGGVVAVALEAGGGSGGRRIKMTGMRTATLGGSARGGVGKKTSSPGGTSARAGARVHSVPSADEPDDPKFDFCRGVNRNGGTFSSPMLGPFTRGNMRKSVYVRHVRAMRAPEVFLDPDTNELISVSSAYNRSRGLECTVCGTSGATVGFYVALCRSVYHFCCLYGSPPPSLSHPEISGPCTRHDDYYAAFCPAHADNAKDEVYVQQMKADADLSTFLQDRASAVDAAPDGNPGLGTDCPSFAVTGIRLNEAETIFCRAWRVASVLPTDSWETVAGRIHRRPLRRGERMVARDVPRRVPRSALDLIGIRAAAVVNGTQTGAQKTVNGQGRVPDGQSMASKAAGPAHVHALEGARRRRRESGNGEEAACANVEDGAAAPVTQAPSRRSSVFLMGDLRESRALGPRIMRLSLPAVPTSYLTTTVVKPAPTRPQSLPAGISRGGDRPATGSGDGRTVGGVGTVLVGDDPLDMGGEGGSATRGVGRRTTRCSGGSAAGGWPQPVPAPVEPR